jgi:hypothetical protein
MRPLYRCARIIEREKTDVVLLVSVLFFFFLFLIFVFSAADFGEALL